MFGEEERRSGTSVEPVACVNGFETGDYRAANER